MSPKRIKIICSHCGGENVMRDAWAVWSTENQEWELGAVFDQGYCDDCDGETSLDEVELRLKPPPVASWHAVYTNGYVDQGYATKTEVDVHPDVTKVLCLELDPDTLEVLSARTEAP